MTPLPRDDHSLSELDPSEDHEAEDIVPDESGEDPRAPEHPPGLDPDREAAEVEPDDKEMKARESAFLATLPPGDLAIIRLFEARPGEFGWLVGRSAEGALLPLRLERAPRNGWPQAFQALQSGSPQSLPETPVWRDASDLARWWKRRGPELYRLMNVDLPNLYDAAGLALEACRESFHAGSVSAPTLAIAELLCREPHVYWWLIFEHETADWTGLLATLTGKYKSLVGSLSVADLEQHWRREGRPVIREVLGE